MSIPTRCAVLVVGGGPAGSYTASVLAREGLDTVLLEADQLPRYHVGESLLPSVRHFLNFIDLDSTFDNHGFIKKVGATFKLNNKRDTFTDFLAEGTLKKHTWNVVRSEADYLMFKHARASGATAVDGVKVKEITFVSLEGDEGSADPEANNVRPVSAAWSSKDGASGVIWFDYLVDATGRAGLISTRYLKNRKYNDGFNNIATWGYWRNARSYSAPEIPDGQPFFEAMTDGSGWAWSIPLHNGTISVGLVVKKDIHIARKKAMGSPAATDFYRESVKLAPKSSTLLSDAELVSGIRSASDWSYSASKYAGPYFRIAGDAGCFIDPYFSSGVHLALTSGLSAAASICASVKGHCRELEAAQWHSEKVFKSYTRFLLVVMLAQKQIAHQNDPILADLTEDSFDIAFRFFRPIIQGFPDVNGQLSRENLSETVAFALNALDRPTSQDKQSPCSESLSSEQVRVLNGRHTWDGTEKPDIFGLDSFKTDVIAGRVMRLEKGSLGLMEVGHLQQVA